MLHPDKAVEIIFENATRLGSETVALADSLGRVLAADVFSFYDLPPFDNSAFDGYAVRHGELAGASVEGPVVLPISARIYAGDVPGKLPEGTCARILTGAPMPAGADTVVAQEDVTAGEEAVTFVASTVPGKHLRYRGEGLAQGKQVLPKGRRIMAGDLGVLAASGAGSVSVYRQPRVGVLSCGDEVVEVGVPLGPGQIVGSNAYTLIGQVREAGGIPIHMGIIPDRLEATIEAFRNAATGADLLINTGGVSVGDRDLVREALVAAGGEEIFWRVASKPGKPLFLGRLASALFLGLPGNPVSTFITFEAFVRPVLKWMAGVDLPFRPKQRAVLAETVKKPKGRRTHIRGRLSRGDGGLLFKAHELQSSGNHASMALCDAIAILEPGSSHQAGADVDVVIVDPSWDDRGQGLAGS